MKAAVSTPNGLELRDTAEPVPKPNEVKVRVRACGLNRADLSAARATFGHGTIGAPVGLEFAGEVAEVGAEVKEFKPGDRVVCAAGGGYAEYAVADYGRTGRCRRASASSKPRCCRWH
jgi:NADPH2:quinone reductase